MTERKPIRKTRIRVAGGARHNVHWWTFAGDRFGPLWNPLCWPRSAPAYEREMDDPRDEDEPCARCISAAKKRGLL